MSRGTMAASTVLVEHYSDFQKAAIEAELLLPQPVLNRTEAFADSFSRFYAQFVHHADAKAHDLLSPEGMHAMEVELHAAHDAANKDRDALIGEARRVFGLRGA
jgi:hypothetical protein